MQRAQVIRLENYLMRLWELKASGRTTATSDELAEVVGVSGSRVRQDMMALHIVGKPRSGYGIGELERHIHEALDLYNTKSMALVGCGNLGRALINSGIWKHAGFTLNAIFDNSPEIIGTQIGKLTVMSVNELARTIKRRSITAGCITVPTPAAQPVADILVEAGVRGIWNFASTDLRVPPEVVLENQHLEHGLMMLSFMLKRQACGGVDPEPEDDLPA